MFHEHWLRVDEFDKLPAKMTPKRGYHNLTERIRNISRQVNGVKCRMVTANVEFT